MILDHTHTSIQDLTYQEKNKMGQGLCPKCGNSAFKVEQNQMVMAMGGSAFVICIECDFTSWTHIFRPKRIASQAEIREVEKKIKLARQQMEAVRRKNEEKINQQRRNEEYNRLLNLRKSASTEEEYLELFQGFKTLCSHTEYADKGIKSLSVEFEEEYLVKKYERLASKTSEALAEDRYRHLTKELRQLARELRDLADRKQRMPKTLRQKASGNDIVGRWVGQENGTVFYWLYREDGTFETNNSPVGFIKGMYRQDAGNLTLSCELGTVTIKATVEDDVLKQTLPNGVRATYAKARSTL